MKRDKSIAEKLYKTFRDCADMYMDRPPYSIKMICEDGGDDESLSCALFFWKAFYGEVSEMAIDMKSLAYLICKKMLDYCAEKNVDRYGFWPHINLGTHQNIQFFLIFCKSYRNKYGAIKYNEECEAVLSLEYEEAVDRYSIKTVNSAMKYKKQMMAMKKDFAETNISMINKHINELNAKKDAYQNMINELESEL